MSCAKRKAQVRQQMSKARQQASLPVDAVRSALDRERSRRKDIKPIELVKVALSAYMAFLDSEEQTNVDGHPVGAIAVESDDRAAWRRGTQSAMDRLLFNANYWRSAYEDRIVEACTQGSNAQACLRALSVWTTHTLRLNTLSPDDAVATFERFCPPFALNQRRGSTERNSAGKGPLPDLRRVIRAIAEEGSEPKEAQDRLRAIAKDIEAEAAVYEAMGGQGSLNALFAILPAWCLQNRIELVSGAWWDDHAVMSAIIDALHARFVELGFGEAVCRYFLDSCYEALDDYHRTLSSDPSSWCELSTQDLVALVREGRDTQPNFESDGYRNDLPAWLISKEQLIWNVWVCSLYGPASARPLLVDSPDLLAIQGYTGNTDVITELAQTSFLRYTTDRIASQTDGEFATFASLPSDLRNSSIAYISSIHDKLRTLGYEVLPAGSCYPERCVAAFTDSEVECLAILEHRRWLRERGQAGWRYAEAKDVEGKRSPYMVAWEELPDRAKEWNRSAVRSIPNLLASVNLAVVK